MINAAGRNIPEIIEGYKTVQPYAGPFALIPSGRMAGPKIRLNKPGSEKLLKSVEQAIDAMPERMGRALRLFRIEGRSQRAIADELGISVSGVEKLLQRAYRILHARLAEVNGAMPVLGMEQDR